MPAIPMIWFYDRTLDTDRLIASLRTALAAHPVLAGRYDGNSPPVAVLLTNAGVPVTVASSPTNPTMTVAEASTDRLPSAPAEGGGTTSTGTCSSRPVVVQYCSTADHVQFVPAKGQMHPDKGDPSVPLMAVKITHFPQGGGTAIGVLAMHTVRSWGGVGGG